MFISPPHFYDDNIPKWWFLFAQPIFKFFFELQQFQGMIWEQEDKEDATRFFFSGSSSFFPHNSYHMYYYYYILQLLHTYNNTYPKPKVLWRLFSKLMIIHPVFDKYSQKWSNKCFLSTIQNQSFVVVVLHFLGRDIWWWRERPLKSGHYHPYKYA